MDVVDFGVEGLGSSFVVVQKGFGIGQRGFVVMVAYFKID